MSIFSDYSSVCCEGYLFDVNKREVGNVDLPGQQLLFEDMYAPKYDYTSMLVSVEHIGNLLDLIYDLMAVNCRVSIVPFEEGSLWMSQPYNLTIFHRNQETISEAIKPYLDSNQASLV